MSEQDNFLAHILTPPETLIPARVAPIVTFGHFAVADLSPPWRDIARDLTLAIRDAAGAPERIMVDREEAARLCSLTVAEYKRYEKRKLLPPMNAVGKVCLVTLRQACLKLDGTIESTLPEDPADRELAEWKRGKKK